MSYTRLLYHIVFRPHNSEPAITEEHEESLYRYIWGFIKNRAEGCKCAGCWKVYGDVAAAKELFAKYKKCTDVYCAMFARGQSIERLTVAV